MEPAIPQGAAVLGEAEKRRLALLRLAEVCAARQLEVVPAVPASGTGIVKLHSVASTQGKKHQSWLSIHVLEHAAHRLFWFARRGPKESGRWASGSSRATAMAPLCALPHRGQERLTPATAAPFVLFT